MKNTFTKAALVKELAAGAKISQKTVRELLDALIQVAYREAGGVNGFTLPGLCRIDTVVRKSRQMRNPRTGETLFIAEHKILRMRPLKKARLAITPPPANLVTVQKEMPPQEVLEDFSKAVSFRCPDCGQEIEAPAAAIGMVAPCPQCGKEVKIPAVSEPGTMHGAPLPPAGQAKAFVAPEVPAAPVHEVPVQAAAPSAAGVPQVTAPAVPQPEVPQSAGFKGLTVVGDGTAQAAAASAGSVAAADAKSQALSTPAPSFAPAEQMKKTQQIEPGKTQVIPSVAADTRKSQTIRIDLSALNFDANGVPTEGPAQPSKRLLSFFCKNCHQEIEAPAEMAGQPAECPSCGATFDVPFFSDPGTLHGSDLEEKAPDSQEVKDMKSRTIRIEVPDDL